MSKESVSDDLGDRFVQLDWKDEREARRAVTERIEEILEPMKYDKEYIDVDAIVDTLMENIYDQLEREAKDPEYVEREDLDEAVQHIAPLDVVILLETDRKI